MDKNLLDTIRALNKILAEVNAADGDRRQTDVPVAKDQRAAPSAADDKDDPIVAPPPLEVPDDAAPMANKAIAAINLVDANMNAIKAALAPFATHKPKVPVKMSASLVMAVTAEEAHAALEAIDPKVREAQKALNVILALSKKLAGYG